MQRYILHADMDAFFASVEQLLHPECRGKPVIVGGLSKRSVVCAASYEARKFGVHSAMPMWEARQRCPQGVFAPVNGPACAAFSRQALEIYLRYTPRLDPISIDEATLDLTGSQRLFGPPEQIAGEIQEVITRELGLSVSLGLAPNRLVAKMASDWHKPHGLTIVSAEQLPELLAPLPVEKLWGLGPATAARLNAQGIHTLGQLQELPQEALARQFGVLGSHLYYACRGEDKALVPLYDGHHEWRQMSEERTLERNTLDKKLLARLLLKLCDSLARRLRKASYTTRTISLKLRLADFKRLSRSVTLSRPTNHERDIYAAAHRLLQAFPLGAKQVRLVGVAASGLGSRGTARQLSLFDDQLQRRGQLCAARDLIIERFGKNALQRATLLDG